MGKIDNNFSFNYVTSNDNEQIISMILYYITLIREIILRRETTRLHGMQ